MSRSLRALIFLPPLIILFANKEYDRAILPAEQAGTFSNPLLLSGPDPWVEQKDGWYYVTHTTGRDLRLYRTKNMSDLSRAEVKTVWTPPGAGMNSKQIWAPEIHFIRDKWYLYYAADDGKNENHRMWVLENDSNDPFNGSWTDKGELRLPGDKWAIDGTAFEHMGQLYFLWSGWEGDANGRQNIYLAKMVNPWTAEKERILLSTPEFGWELKGGNPLINEAPQFLAHGNKVFVIYSASGCWTDDYSLGLMSAPAAADLALASSWEKFHQPVFKKNISAHAYGPGHNSFFTSPDGKEDWILYHANPEPDQGCGGRRSTRMQRFAWTREGFPEFGTPVELGVEIKNPSGEHH